MCVVREVEVCGRSEVCGWGGVDVGGGSMSVVWCVMCVCCVG